MQFSYIKLQKKTQETKERLMDRQTDINRQEDMEMKRQAGRPTESVVLTFRQIDGHLD